MGVRTIFDRSEELAALYCSTSGWAFGPIFHGPAADEQAQSFLDWLNCDPRHLPDLLLRDAKSEWHGMYVDEDGFIREMPLPMSDAALEVLGKVQQADHEWQRRLRLSAR